MRTPLVSLLALPCIAACSGGDAAGPDAGAPVEPFTVTVTAPTMGVLAARPGDGPWQTLARNGDGVATFEATGPYVVLGVCPEADLKNPEVRAIAAGPGDAVAWTLPCYTTRPEVAVTVRDASATEGASAWISSHGSTLNPATGGTSIDVPVGVYDVALVDERAHRVALRRGVAVNGATTVELDLAAGAALVAHPLTGVPDGTTITSFGTTAADTSIVVSDSGDVAPTGWSLPASLAQAGDQHTVQLDRYTAEPPRAVGRFYRLDPASEATIAVALPPAMTSASGAMTPLPHASFVAVGDWQRVNLIAVGIGRDTASWWLTRHPGAAGAADAIEFPDPRTIAGWDPAWDLASGAGERLEVLVERDTADGAESAAVSAL